MVTYFKVLFLLVIVFSNGAYAQIATDTWRDHLPYHKGIQVAIAGNIVYCATESAVFYYDKEDRSLNKLSKINGLSDLNVGSIAWSESHKTLIIGYTNGNIDLIVNGVIYNIADIKDKNLLADKTIRNISLFNGNAYMSCGFGIVVLNIGKQEISDTYLIGEDGGYLGVNYVGIINDSIYALTDDGILKSNYSNAFLSYYGSWVKDTIIEYHDAKFFSGTVINNELYVINSEKKLSVLRNSEWNYLSEIWWVESISGRNNNLFVSKGNQVEIYDQSFNQTEVIEISRAMHAAADSEGSIFIASLEEGLVFEENGEYSGHHPDGPIATNAFRIAANGNDIVTTFGAFRFYPIRFYSLSDERSLWENYSYKTHELIKDMGDATAIGATGKEGTYYIGTWGYGLAEVKNSVITNVYNEENTNGVISTQATGAYSGISAIAFDKGGNMWMMQRNHEKPYTVLTTDGKWYNYSRGSSMLKVGQTGELINTKDNDFWTISPRGNGIAVFNSDNPSVGIDNFEEFKFYAQDGTLISSDLNAIAEDKEGAIWIGGTNGIGVYDEPEKILQGGSQRARLPQQEVDGYLHNLLEGAVVTSIVVDGANRKWVGTLGSGLFLVSADGTEQILNLSTKNSPLFSDNITSMAMNPRNGELFIGTDVGMLSYMTSSSEPNENFADVYAFPNPVRPEYSGMVTVRGLMYETTVKITDASGNLVYEGESNGGDFVWNRRDMSGNSVSSGLYMVLCATADGSEYEATKILIVK